jgi:hypothetical protein
MRCTYSSNANQYPQWSFLFAQTQKSASLIDKPKNEQKQEKREPFCAGQFLKIIAGTKTNDGKLPKWSAT